MPDGDVLASYYARYEPTVVDDFRDRKLVELQAGLWAYLTSHLPPGRVPKVLDYGFGAGAFLKYVAGTGGAIYGVDFGAQNIHQLSRWCAQHDVPIRLLDVGARPLSALGRERINLITLFQVVEHLVDPVATIRSLAALQDPSGLLYIECPHQDAWFFRAKNCCRRLISREFMYGSVSPPQHVLGFNRRSLRVLLERCRYRVLEIGDYCVADGVHAPETVDWYPTLREWLSSPRKRTALGLGKTVIRWIDVPLSRFFGLGGGLFALAERA